MTTPMTLSEAIELTGGLSKPSKMPCHSYNLPAQECQIGGKLRNIKNSVCHTCYAFRGNYLFSGPQNAMKKRFKAISKKIWVEAMIFLIKNTETSKKYL